MSSMDDKKFRKLMHAYELGMLSEDDRAWMELKIMENEAYFDLVNNDERISKLLRNDPDIQDHINKIAEKLSSKTEILDQPKSRFAFSKVWKSLVPLTVIIIIFLVLNDWDITFKPSKEAVAADNKILILPFTTTPDQDARFDYGQIIPNLLITDLSESNYVQTISGQNVFDILRRLKIPEKTPIGRAQSLEIAQSAKARWIMVGNIASLEPNLEVRIQIINSADGTILLSRDVTARAGEDIFGMIDRISKSVKAGLDLPSEAQSENDPNIAEITTSSPEAYQAFNLGENYYNRMDFTEAFRHFRDAVKYDSTFAMAYYYLALIGDNNAISKAGQYIDRADEKGRYYIRSLMALADNDAKDYIAELKKLTQKYPDEKDAYYSLGDYYYKVASYRKCIEFMDSALRIDPLYGRALNLKAYSFNAVGDFENTILTINKYIQLYPNLANPLDSRADFYASDGDLDLAVESYKDAVKVNPEFYESWRKLGVMYIYKKEYAKADSCFTIVAKGNPDNQSFNLIFHNVLSPWYKGDWSGTLKIFDSLLNWDIGQKEWLQAVVDLRSRGFFHYSHGEYGLAMDDAGKMLSLYDSTKYGGRIKNRHFVVLFLAGEGNFEGAQIQLDSLKAALGDDYSRSDNYWFAEGALAFAEGHYDNAIQSLEKASEIRSSFTTNYLLARSYLEINRYDRAIEYFEGELRKYGDSWRLCLVDWNIDAHYYLGRAYEESRWSHKAVDQYRIFLSYRTGDRKNDKLFADAEKRLEELSANF